MEKDLKSETETQEQTEEEYSNDFYDDTDNYIIGKALMQSLKKDPESTRPRNTPVSKLTINDEDSIPKMPDKILPMPLTQEEFDNKRMEYIEQMNNKKENIKKLFEEIKRVYAGLKGDKKNKINDEYAQLKKRREDIEKALKIEDDKNSEIKSTIDKLNEEVKQFDKLKLIPNIRIIEEEIKSIQESLSFGDLSAAEEKDLLDRKASVVAYLKAIRQQREYKSKNRDKLQKGNDLRKELRELKLKMEPMAKILSAEFKRKKEEKQKNILQAEDKREENPIIAQLKLQISILKQEKKKLKEELDAFYIDQTNKWNEYNEQQSLIDYITRARKKIRDLKMIEKKKEKAQKEREKNGNVKESEIIKEGGREIIKSKQYAKEEADCDYLYSYFSKLLPKGEEQKISFNQIDNKTNTKLDEDIAKGLLKEFKRDQSVFGTSDPVHKKKKGKKPKIGKVEEQFFVDFEILNIINHLKLTAPLKLEGIPKFLKELEEKKKEFAQIGYK